MRLRPGSFVLALLGLCLAFVGAACNPSPSPLPTLVATPTTLPTTAAPSAAATVIPTKVAVLPTATQAPSATLPPTTAVPLVRTTVPTTAAPSPTNIPTTPTPVPTIAPTGTPTHAQEWTIGPSNAFLTIVMYGDFQSPLCLDVARSLEIIRERYQNDVRLVWRNFPQSDNDKAALAAQAAEAAADQGKFWEMHDQLLAHQSE